jgi:DNA-formamidopyrimidine glycosylase
MPEAPEIRQYADDLIDFFNNKQIINIKIHSGRYIRHSLPKNLNELNKLLPQKIKDIKTKGKFIYIILNNGYVLAFTMGLSGFFTTDPLKHNHIEFVTNKGSIFMNDMRNFGTFEVQPNLDKLNIKLNKLGPDIFNISEIEFTNIIKESPNIEIGVLLMKQEKIAGIGNYLRAEILWLSKISPFRKIKNLTNTEIHLIYQNSLKLVWYFYDIKQALDKKIVSDKDKYPVDYKRDFFIYGEKKDIYNNEIVKETLANRTIHYVPNYQK